jgi:hypothetical protein
MRANVTDVRIGRASPTVTGTASDLLLWLYSRAELPVAPESTEVIDRFRGLCLTD